MRGKVVLGKSMKNMCIYAKQDRQRTCSPEIGDTFVREP